MIWRMEKKEDKGKRIQLRKGVKMSTEEYQNLLVCCVATEILSAKKECLVSLLGSVMFLCVMMTPVIRD